METFDIKKYLGVWYELAHYPSWFQRNDNYNTMAVYSIENGHIKVLNSTISNGKKIESVGTADYLGANVLNVNFPISEVMKLGQSGEFQNFKPKISNLPNYVVDRVWTNKYGEYIFAVVTDTLQQSLYVLSRFNHPSLIAYNEIFSYVVSNYDRDRLVQTPHFG